jgi:hypothetical protein
VKPQDTSPDSVSQATVSACVEFALAEAISTYTYLSTISGADAARGAARALVGHFPGTATASQLYAALCDESVFTRVKEARRG